MTVLSRLNPSIKTFGEWIQMSSVTLIRPKRFHDNRGWFTEIYNEQVFSNIGITDRFVQDNHSFSVDTGTLRGLHFQVPPFAQAKLVRCTRGSIYDVVVDVRRDSPTFGKWVSAELSSENGNQLYVPIGFAHGFVTLEPNTEVTYKVSAHYSQSCDAGILWCDPEIGIAWPRCDIDPILSAKDGELPILRSIVSPFAFDGVPLCLSEV